MYGRSVIAAQILALTLAAAMLLGGCGHHHHHDDEDEDNCCCGHHHHHDDEDEDEHEHHHHHDHDHDEEEAHEHHHHEHDEHCTCGCHDHDHDHEHHHHHHDHDADEVFTSWGVETARKFDKETVEKALHALDSGKYGMILRAKGILPAVDGSWIYFDYVPEETNVRLGSADITGKLCVIGSKLDEQAIAQLFGV